MKGSKENYLMQLISRAKYLEPEVTEAEVVNKLAPHFGHGIQITVITQGVKSLEELLLLLTKWDNVDNPSNNSNNDQSRKQFQSQHQQQQFKKTKVSKIQSQQNIGNYREQCK